MQTRADSRLLKISSKDRSEESPSKYQIVYRTNDTDLHQIKKVALKSAIIPNNQYNINANNNLFNFPNTLGGPLYTVPVGQYTTTTLIADLNAQITGLTITQSTLTQKLTFTMAGGTFDIISDPVLNPIAYVLGLETDASTVALYTSDSFPDLSGLQNIYIASQTLSNHTSMITSNKLKQNVFCNVGISVPFGGTMILEEDDSTLDFSVFHSHKNISSIDITLLDERNNVLDLNGADWQLIFRVYS
tara:strand:+ start:85 stop:822 length:738 start_codon:yes stop_codon:yes gene_type:complete